MQRRDPDGGSLREHLREIHRRNPGFMERCATRSRDECGRTTYEWLCEEAQDPGAHNILNLACGSGFLLAKCLELCPDAERLTGIDMSPEELALAQERLNSPKVRLRQGYAQDLNFVDTGSQDAVLCHWALTLMEPLDAVLSEIGRVTKPGGVFSAIVDGDAAIAPQYGAIDAMIFRHVSRIIPGYGDRDLGDPRVRTPQALAELCRRVFDKAEITIENTVFSLTGTAEAVANEALGFYYAAFVLPPEDRRLLLREITDYLTDQAGAQDAVYPMPVCKLSVRMHGGQNIRP